MEDFHLLLIFKTKFVKQGLHPKTHEFQSTLNCAYYFDAQKVVDLIKEKALELGVNHVIDKLIDVYLDDAGYIDYQGCEKSGRVDGDLFIDCSGFAAVLIDKTMKVPLISEQ